MTGEIGCPELNWFKSSYSSPEGQCIECAALGKDGMAVRDSKQPNGPALRFSATAWRGFGDSITAV